MFDVTRQAEWERAMNRAELAGDWAPVIELLNDGEGLSGYHAAQLARVLQSAGFRPLKHQAARTAHMVARVVELIALVDKRTTFYAAHGIKVGGREMIFDHVAREFHVTPGAVQRAYTRHRGKVKGQVGPKLSVAKTGVKKR
jgi:hypothetical protein